MTEDPTIEKQKKISITRTFKLPLTKVWRAWTDAELCKKWCGPKEYTCENYIIDFKVGGKYLNSMKGPDGKEIWSTGTYKEIIPLKKIVCTDSFLDSEGNIVQASYYKLHGQWAHELIMTIQFEEKDGKTIMKLDHIGILSEMAEECIKGWESSFDKLENIFCK